MGLFQIAARVASRRYAEEANPASAQPTPVKVSAPILDGGGYSAGDIVGAAVNDLPGPVWVAWHGYGWLAVSQDPSTMTPETPVEGGPQWSGREAVKNWGELLQESYFSDPPLGEFKQYPSMNDFVADEDTLRWMCSHDKNEKPEIQQALEEEGFPEAAAKLQSVKM